jgi:hypothetical protein
MYRLFLLLKDQKEPATEDKIAIATGKKVLDPAMATDYLAKLQKSSSNLVDALHRQNERAAVCLQNSITLTRDTDGV